MLKKKRFGLFVLLLLVLCLVLSACSLPYLLKAGAKQADILMRREKIETLLAKEELEPALREKLQYVTAAREYAIKLGLTPGDSYLYYTEIEGEYVLWVVMGSRKDAFALKTWWYPIVGTVPYKGFFEKEDAERAEQELKEQGLDTWMRGASAYSTLGWFSDPILSSTLASNIPDICNTVIHEIFHATYWFPGQVEFNETVANFVGSRAIVDFFAERGEEAFKEHSLYGLRFERLLSTALEELRERLTELYESELETAEKEQKRELILEESLREFREQFPRAELLKSVNNAEIMQLAVYRQGFDTIEELFISCSESWDCFMKEMKLLSKNLKNGDPYQLLEQRIKERNDELQ